MNTVGKGVIAGSVIAAVILFIGMCLFIAGWSIVSPTYMAISRNKMTSKIDPNKVYFEGRHFLGVGNEFIIYPMAWQLVEYTDDALIGTSDYICKIDAPLDASTSEGLPMEVELSLYFTIPPQQLINFYKTYGINYQESIANECKKVLKDTMTKFRYEEVFKGRLAISSAMESALNRSLTRRRCVLQKLLLRAINFTESIENNIESSVIADQAKNANEFKNQITMIKAEIESLKKQYAYRVNIITSEAQKNATKVIEDAKAYSASVYATSTASAWGNYQSKTQLDPQSLLRVQWARALGATSAKDSIALGYDTVGANFVQKVKDA